MEYKKYDKILLRFIKEDKEYTLINGHGKRVTPYMWYRNKLRCTNKYCANRKIQYIPTWEFKNGFALSFPSYTRCGIFSLPYGEVSPNQRKKWTNFLLEKCNFEQDMLDLFKKACIIRYGELATQEFVDDKLKGVVPKSYKTFHTWLKVMLNRGTGVGSLLTALYKKTDYGFFNVFKSELLKIA